MNDPNYTLIQHMFFNLLSMGPNWFVQFLTCKVYLEYDAEKYSYSGL